MIKDEKVKPDEGREDSAWLEFLLLEAHINEGMATLSDKYRSWSTNDPSGKGLQLQGSEKGR